MAAGRVKRWELEFNDIPPGPNDRMHFMVRAKETKRWRRWAALLAGGIPPQSRVRLSAIFRRRALGRADADNDLARLKPVADGVVAAGVVPDDNRAYVEWGPVTEERGDRGFVLIIEGLEELR